MSFAKNQNVIDASQEVNNDELYAALETAKKFKPYYDRILIKRTQSALERKATKAGLILTEQTKTTTLASEGWVVAVGDGCNDKAKASLGKRILFSKYTGDNIYLQNKYGDSEDFVFATDRDIYGELV